MNTEVTIVDKRGLAKVYALVQKAADAWGILRFNISEVGSEAKPYSISYHPDKYKDSAVSGWGCSCKGWTIKRGEKRDCKHIRAVSVMIEKKSA
jgi:hypothetical protein